MVPIDQPKIMHHMSASKKSTRVLRPQSKKYKYGNIFNVPVGHFSKIELK